MSKRALFAIKKWEAARKEFESLPEDAYLDKKQLHKLSQAIARKRAAEWELTLIAMENKDD